MTCRARSDAPKSDIEPYEQLLFDGSGAHDVLWSMYFNIPAFQPCIDSVKMPSNCYVACGPYFELDYDETIRHAKKLFTQLYEMEEFLPRAPDPEEIIIEGDNPTDPLPSIVAELNLDIPSSQNDSVSADEETSAIDANVQNDTQQNTQ